MPTRNNPRDEDFPVTKRKAHDMKHLSAAEILQNKYYVGSHNALHNGWGHVTLEKAISHATDLLEKSGEEQFIVQIIRLVRRKTSPVEVKTVPNDDRSRPKSQKRRRR